MKAPAGWQKSSLGNQVELLTGFPFASGSYSDAEDGVRLLRGDNVLPNRVRWLGAKRWNLQDAGSLDRFALRQGDVVIAMDRTWISSGAKVAMISKVDTPSLLVQRVARLRSGRELDQHFLFQILSGFPFEQYVRMGKTETAVPHISPQHIREFPVLVPPLAEQRNIAEILRTWDDAIDSNSRLVEVSKLRFARLRSGLLGEPLGERLSSISKKLFQIATRLSRKNNGEFHPVMTISAKSGFVLQSDKYNRDMAGSSVANYTLLKRGEFAYNKGNSLPYPQGCVFSMPHDSALVPNVYISFAFNDGLNGRYFEHVFASGHLNSQLARLINSGVRNDGLLNLNVEDFFECEVPVPSAQQQMLIANALDEAQREVDLLVAIGDKLRTQKRGLMQKLLTGEIRVTGNSSESLGEASDG